MYYTDSIWSHCGMFSENGQVIDQTISGGVEHDFYDYCDGKHYVAVYKLKELSDEQRDKLLSGMKSLLGPGYGWFQALVMFSRIILGAQDRPSLPICMRHWYAGV